MHKANGICFISGLRTFILGNDAFISTNESIKTLFIDAKPTMRMALIRGLLSNEPHICAHLLLLIKRFT